MRSADRNHNARIAVVRISTAPLVLVDEVVLGAVMSSAGVDRLQHQYAHHLERTVA